MIIPTLMFLSLFVFSAACSGIHRSLGVHLSKVRSLTLDNKIYQEDLQSWICEMGNERANEIWEAVRTHTQYINTTMGGNDTIFMVSCLIIWKDSVDKSLNYN